MNQQLLEEVLKQYVARSSVMLVVVSERFSYILDLLAETGVQALFDFHSLQRDFDDTRACPRMAFGSPVPPCRVDPASHEFFVIYAQFFQDPLM